MYGSPECLYYLYCALHMRRSHFAAQMYEIVGLSIYSPGLGDPCYAVDL